MLENNPILSMIWLWTLKTKSRDTFISAILQKPVSLNMKMLYFRHNSWQIFIMIRDAWDAFLFVQPPDFEQPAGDKVILYLVRSFVSVYFTDTINREA